MKGYATLVNGEIVEAHDLMVWALWFADVSNRHVGYMKRDGKAVSTVFLGVDHGFGYGPPQWFETLISGTDYCERYATLEEAIAGHSRACIETFGELAL